MNEQEKQIADAIYGAIQSASNYSERSQQSASFRIGPSDLGFCSEKVRRMLVGIPEPETDKLPAFIGTALGDHVEKAVLEYLWPNAIIQSEVTVELQGDQRTYTISGHPDILIDNKVLDVKSVDGLDVKRKSGPDMQQQFQRHCYAKGAFEAGLLTADSLDDVMVANVWIDRAAKDRELHVQMEPYSEDVVRQAAMWIDDVIYAYLNEGEAQKEPPFAMCQKTCGHFATCRAGEGVVSGLITDPELLAAVDLMVEARELESRAKRMKNSAQVALKGVEGSTGAYSLKWTLINGGPVTYDRNSFLRLDLRKVK